MEKVAKISKLYGSEGEVVINLLSTFPDEFSVENPLFVKVDNLFVPLYCERFERRGKTGAIVRFADIDNERRALEFVGRDLMLTESEEEEPSDEFFMEDLIGFKVEIVGDEPLAGELVGYIDSESNPLFEVVINGSEALIPAAEEFIHSIDFEGETIRFIIPEGLLEL